VIGPAQPDLITATPFERQSAGSCPRDAPGGHNNKDMAVMVELQNTGDHGLKSFAFNCVLRAGFDRYIAFKRRPHVPACRQNQKQRRNAKCAFAWGIFACNWFQCLRCQTGYGPPQCSTTPESSLVSISTSAASRNGMQQVLRDAGCNLISIV
jgi:hypothetical protein